MFTRILTLIALTATLLAAAPSRQGRQVLPRLREQLPQWHVLLPPLDAEG